MKIPNIYITASERLSNKMTKFARNDLSEAFYFRSIDWRIVSLVCSRISAAMKESIFQFMAGYSIQKHCVVCCVNNESRVGF